MVGDALNEVDQAKAFLKKSQKRAEPETHLNLSAAL